MSLLQYPAPVDYRRQLEAFKDFLKHFKSFDSSEAIEDLHIDGDDLGDGYDLMDDAEDGAQSGRRKREPKNKYMQILQEVANRERNHILIELDDLDSVSRK